ncbi:MAG: hypothetical protein K8H88_12005 [Sandaracinaceae bacterium]|nr:hypothetical protein [Sandaracinaceae bacterium]
MTPALRAALAAAVVLVTCGATAHAQRSTEAFLDEREHENAIRITGEMDPALAFGIGYVRTVPIDVDRYARRLGVHVDLTTILGATSWDLAGGVTLPLFEGPGPNALLGVDLELKVAQNDVHTAIVYGYGASLRPGWFDPVWYVAADLAIRGTFAASIIHRDAYREQVPSARDATYLTGQLALYFGGVVGFHIERTVVLGLRFAWRFAYTFDAYAPWYQPYTIDVEAAWRF